MSLDQLTDQEREQILERDKGRCFIDGHPLESDDVEFDHIIPRAAGGPTTVENMAAVCRKHNRQKGTMSLAEYRDYLELRRFFDSEGPKYLDHVIAAKGGLVGDPLQYEVDGDGVTLYLDDGRRSFSLYTCPITGWQYFYALIPVRHLKNDSELQPRPLRDTSMWGLYRHFRYNTQLAPSICRFDDSGDLLLFDGQHKAAAQVWAGRDAVECKVYVKPDSVKLRETNLEAHQSFRQMAFYTSELMDKYAAIFKEDWEAFLALEGKKSEQAFVDYLVQSKNISVTRAKKQVAFAIHERIMKSEGNELTAFVSAKTRTRTQPLTHNRIEKTIFRHLLSPIPSTAEFQSEGDFREVEQKNLVRIASIIAEEGLIGRWNLT